jgi:DNA-binding response OmpR family regulator
MNIQKKVLVIDDDEADRNFFKLALEKSEIVVTAVSSGEEGVIEIQKGYQLVFLDLKMTGMNGIQTFRKIRELFADVPVYIVTAFHKEFLLELDSLRSLGFKFQLLRKPIGMAEIIALTESVLSCPISFD